MGSGAVTCRERAVKQPEVTSDQSYYRTPRDVTIIGEDDGERKNEPFLSSCEDKEWLETSSTKMID